MTASRLLCILALASARQPTILPTGSVGAVYALLERKLPGESANFTLTLVDACDHDLAAPCYAVTASGAGDVSVAASGANELAAGLGAYLREVANLTIGWPRGGGSRVEVPASAWPAATFARRRIVPWSYALNVCTHSYSLVWYGEDEWIAFIDWLALSGINNFVAQTGQEEMQYRVFSQFGLNDTEIRLWFNGPALLTWSRGQNEYGSGIAGPLPRSFMQRQHALQRDIILPQARALGIVGQLPGFQGNAPIALKARLADDNMTDNGLGTAWIDALDPVFGEIADVWMAQLVQDFGTDHWYQVDGYFNGDTAPWRRRRLREADKERATRVAPPADPAWAARGRAVYTALNRTDPDAIWSYQGWAINGWDNDPGKVAGFRGFVDSAPPGKFSIVDMSYDGRGQWRDWDVDGDGGAFFGANFIWTSLHDFGGTDSLRGNLTRANEIPFSAMGSSHAGKANVWGTGFTPEGIDQNPAFYELVIEQNWRAAPIANMTEHLIERAHRRYALAAHDVDVADAWARLELSSYVLDQWGQDTGGVGHLPGTNYNNYAWQRDSAMPPTPTGAMCDVFGAWSSLLRAAERGGELDVTAEPFKYDLVNTGREVLSQLALPLSLAFNESLGSGGAPPDASRVVATSGAYVGLLTDLDDLVATDSAFLLGGWTQAARALAGNTTDCSADGFPEIAWTCAHFYEFNARVQITTWDPTRRGAAKPGVETVDYAPKHWSGLIKDYYAARVGVVAAVALAAAAKGVPLAPGDVDRAKAELAYNWTTAENAYPSEPSGDAVVVSRTMHDRYAHYFGIC